ncbi:MAG: domain S-box/diguanylate cyclase protein [Frankiales bacterium]|nr:domain S-box/diguanylate cyclase protein [Frankiales bacterium]
MGAGVQGVEAGLRRMLARSEALVGLATTQKPVQELLDHSVHLGAATFPGATVALFVLNAEGTALTLAAVSAGAADGERPVPEDWATTVTASAIDIAVRRDSGEPCALLAVTAGRIDADDVAFAHRLAEVIGVCMARGRREEELVRNERRLVEAQRISHVGSYDFDIAANTNQWSDQLYRIFAREPQSFTPNYEAFMGVLHPDDRELVAAVHQHALATLEPFEMEERIVWPDGQVRTLASWGEVVPGPDGQPARMVGICWDITERREIEEELVRQALHDRLTGLPNRALLVDRLAHGLTTMERHEQRLAVLFIDIDRFKVINDSLGHEAGDEVLVEVARRLRAFMRPSDTVARFGGDEFVVLCEELDDPAQALSIAGRVQVELRRPIAVRGSEMFVTVSVGIALSSGRDDVASSLLRDADAAMYQAKQDGRARTVVFADSMRAQAMDRLDTEVELRRALAEGQLRVHYQPLCDVKTGALVGLEALVRWQHPVRGLVEPREFIPIAEETGLIVPLGEWVLEHACTQLAAWHRAYPERAHLSVAVNLSGSQIVQPDFVFRIAEILDRSGVDRSKVELEITESVLMRDAEDTLAVLHAVKTLGVRLSVDDFGTGFSSLSYLKRFPVDALKIDRSFVDGLGQDAEDSAIVQAVQALAVSLGMTTVAEGVETELQLRVLHELGCGRAQGFWFSRPVPAEEITVLLAG